MNKIVEFLEENKYGNLATSVDGQPYVRPFEFTFNDKDGFYFYTSDDKKVYSDLKKNPRVSFCSTDKDLSYVQIIGNVEFTDDKTCKENVLRNSDYASKIYKSASNDNFKVFKITKGTAVMHEGEKGYTEEMNFN